jgi:beta-galactosidase
MVSQGQADALEKFVEQGGTFVTGYFSGVINETHRTWLGGFPGPLRDLLGIWVEEFDPLPEGSFNRLIPTPDIADWQAEYSCTNWCEVVHLGGAQALSVFGEDFYAGYPALTEHDYGSGKALYVAAHMEDSGLDGLVNMLAKRLQLSAPVSTPDGIEVTQRTSDQQTYTFLLNHRPFKQEISLSHPMYDILTKQIYSQAIELPAWGVALLVSEE